MTNDLLYIDELQMFCGAQYQITDKIIIQQPTVKEIIKYGEQDYFKTVFSITSTPTSMMSELDDLGFDFTKMTDFQLFIMLTRKLQAKDMDLLIPGIDFGNMIVGQKTSTEELVLQDPVNNIIIDELMYERIINFIRKTHGITAQKRKAANKATRLAMIANDRETKALQSKKNKEFHSVLLPMIISLECTEEFKYNLDEIMDLTYYQLTLYLKQIQKKKNAISLLNGYYSGAFDKDKFKTDSLVWTYEP